MSSKALWLLCAVAQLLLAPAWASVGGARDGSVPPEPRAAAGWADELDDFSHVSARSRGLSIRAGWVTVGDVEGEGFSWEADNDTVALYHFDEGLGSVARDSGPNRLDGALQNMDPATDWVEGVGGMALDFDGASHNVLVDSSAVFNLPRVTVEAWVFERSSPEHGCTYILAKRSGYMLMDKEFMIDTPTVVWASDYSPELYRWQYLAGTFDGQFVRFYRDGRLAASTATGGSIQNNQDFLQIGAWGGQGPFYVFDGLIDEVRLSGRARSAEEINDTWLEYLERHPGYKIPRTYLVSENITIPPGNYWDRLDAVSERPENTSLDITVLDAATGEAIPGFERQGAGALDLSGISPLSHPAIRLRADLASFQTFAPSLDRWNVSWRPNLPPRLVDASIVKDIFRTFTAPLFINASDPDQPPGTLKLDVETRYRWDEAWTRSFLGAPAFLPAGNWLCLFTPDSSALCGPYHFRVTVTDELGLNVTLVLENAIYVHYEGQPGLSFPDNGTAVFRTLTRTVGFLPLLDGPPEDMSVSFVFLGRDGSALPWAGAPYWKDQRWLVDITTPAEAPLGYYDVRINASNPFGQSVGETFRDAILVRNCPPYWKADPSFGIDEDSPAELDMSTFVADNDTPLDRLTLTLLSSSDTDNLAVSLKGTMLTVDHLRRDWSGTALFAFRLSDGMDTADAAFVFTVRAVADPPVPEPVPDLAGYEDSLLTYNFTASDPDPGDRLKFGIDLSSLGEPPGGFSFDASKGELRLPLTNDLVGTHPCRMSVSDGRFTVARPFNLTVINVNDPPGWDRVPADAVLLPGEAYSFQAGARDIDRGDTLVFRASTAPDSNLTVDSATGLVTWTAGPRGRYLVNLRVSDGNATICHEFTLTVNERAQPRVRTDICPAAYVLLAILGIGAAVCAIYIRTRR